MSRPPESVLVQAAGVPGYQVLVGHDLDDQLATAVATYPACLLVHPVALRRRAGRLRRRLATGGPRLGMVEVPDGEQAKRLDAAEQVYQGAAELGLDRGGVVVGLGGGAVTDLAGFVASTWMRGVAVIQVPTTLLGMVDAAIGGKTAVNTSAGKNLVGSFHHPRLVVCDLAALATLPAAELRSGLAEVIKCGFIDDRAILDAFALDPTGTERLPELVRRAVACKAAVVAEDPREAGRRAILNYGHTLGHAIEAAEGYHWRHGEAVSVGMVYAATLSSLVLGLAPGTVALHRDVLGGAGLPVTYDRTPWERLRALMAVDKKTRDGALRLVLLREIGDAQLVPAPPAAQLAAAFRAVASRTG